MRCGGAGGIAPPLNPAGRRYGGAYGMGLRAWFWRNHSICDWSGHILRKKTFQGRSELRPDSDLTLSITPTGNVLFACIVGFWLICLIARVFAAEGALGRLLGGVDGVEPYL